MWFTTWMVRDGRMTTVPVLPPTDLKRPLDGAEVEFLLPSTLRSSSGVSSGQEYMRSQHPRDYMCTTRTRCDNNVGIGDPDMHDYLEVDIVSRIRSLQSEVDILKNFLQASGTSTKSKDSIYANIDEKPTMWSSAGLVNFINKGSKSRGFYHFSRIWDSQSSGCCKFVWMLLLLSSLCLTGYQLFDRFMYYQSSPHHVMVESRIKENLIFPAVTICNLNPYSLTKVAEQNLYDIMYAVQHNRSNLRQADVVKHAAALNVSYESFLQNNGHRLEDILYKCSLLSTECGPVNFTETYLDQGLCYTFVPDLDSRLIDTAGPQNGLFLMINVEQYDYILGPTSAVGLKIAIHEATDPPRHFLHVPVGKLTSVEMKKFKKETIQRGYGLLGALSNIGGAHEDDECNFACKEKTIVDQCHCAMPQFKSKSRFVRDCTMFDFVTCVSKLQDSKDDCPCPRRCTDMEYEITLSYATVPKYGIESEVRTLRHRSKLEEKFRTAMDIYHRVDSVMSEYDRNMMLNLSRGVKSCENITSSFAKFILQNNREYEKIRRQLESTFNKLNQTVRAHYDYFKSNKHVSFSSVTTLSVSELVDLTSKNRADFAIPETLNDTLWKIEQQVDTKKSAAGTSPPKLREIQEGIQNFKKDLVTGYGLQYREFKSKRYEYGSLITKLLNITENIATTLLQDYLLIGNIAKKRPSSQRHSSDKMDMVIKDFNRLRTGEVEEMRLNLQRLFQMYHKDRRSILSILDKFNETGKTFKSGIDFFNKYIVSVNHSVFQVSLKLSHIETHLANVADAFINYKLGKLDLGKKFDANIIATESTDIEGLIRAITKSVDEMSAESQKLASSLTLTRLVDFGLVDTKRTGQALDWLNSLPLAAEVKSVVEQIEEVLAAISSYQKELATYTNGRKINEAFYRSNFLHLDIYFDEISETIQREEISYSFFDFVCDIGCTLALYLGASILSVFELLDFVRSCSVYAITKKES